jgi:ubiquinone/menaquinone biosynthesis C-methylase UbiE
MDSHTRQQLEKQYHESDDQARSTSSLISRVYSSNLFTEAEDHHLDALGDVRGARVLDYGCGDGRSTARLLSRGARVAGFDISRTRLALAQQHVAAAVGAAPGAAPAQLALCAAEMLPFRDASFDAVFGKQILHHLDLGAAIPEIVRVLRPGGRAVFLEPLIHNPVLQGYRLLTPRLRSPTEQALSMADLRFIAAHFKGWSHTEFCLLAVLPVLVDAVVFRRPRLARLTNWFQRLDRALVKAIPFAGRYYWETVVTLVR